MTGYRGTVVCAVADSQGGRGALALASDLSARLGLRLVLVHVAAARGAGTELLARLAAEQGLADADRRTGVGDPPEVIAQVAAEEAADLIVVGSRATGRGRRGLRSPLAGALELETPVPVVVAPPRRPGRVRAPLAAPLGRRPVGVR